MALDLNTRTIAEEAQTALDVQNAVNLSGVVHSLSRTMSTLWNEANRIGEGTEWVNSHPIVRLYLDKLQSLAGSPSDLSHDYEHVKALANPKMDEQPRDGVVVLPGMWIL
jgi:hypothetical protein